MTAMYRRALFFLVCSFFAVNVQSQPDTKPPAVPPDSVVKKVISPRAVAVGQPLELKTGGETFLFYFANEGGYFFTANVLSGSGRSRVNYSVDTIWRSTGCFYRPVIDTAWWANLDNDPANELCVVVEHTWLCDSGTPYYTASFYDDPAHRFALLPVSRALAIHFSCLGTDHFAIRKRVIEVMKQNKLPRK
jgi:hypothetical protein